MHFDFEGYDTEPFWDDDGKSYINGGHAWKVLYENHSVLSGELVANFSKAHLSCRRKPTCLLGKWENGETSGTARAAMCVSLSLSQETERVHGKRY